MMLLAFFAVWSFASTTPLASGKGAREARQPKFAAAVKWLIVVLGVATLVMAFRARKIGMAEVEGFDGRLSLAAALLGFLVLFFAGQAAFIILTTLG